MHGNHILITGYRIFLFPEKAGAANGMSRGQHGLDADISKGYRFLIGIKLIRFKVLYMRAGIRDHGFLRAALHEYIVLFGHTNLCSGQRLHFSCCSAVIEMRMADQDFLNISRLVSQCIDRIYHQIRALRNCAVDQDQAIACIDQIAANPGLTCYIPGVRRYLKRLDCQCPRLMYKSFYRMWDCRATMK